MEFLPAVQFFIAFMNLYIKGIKKLLFYFKNNNERYHSGFFLRNKPKKGRFSHRPFLKLFKNLFFVNKFFEFFAC